MTEREAIKNLKDILDRDVNASINIFNVGLILLSI